MKRSYIESIKKKQSSAYRADRTSAQALHQIDGSSRREVSRSRIQPLRSFEPPKPLDRGTIEAIATRQINELLYGSKIKPRKVRESICSICWTMKSKSGSCCER